MKFAVLGVTLPGAASLLTACGGGDDGMEPTPRLASVDNFRDLAGADDAGVYRNAQGRGLRRGAFYRSNAVTPSDADWARLNTLDIKTVHDLRTPAESRAKPDRLPQGATLLSVDVSGDTYVMPTFHTAAEGVRVMEDAERVLVTNAGVRERLGGLLTTMAGRQGVQVFHCTAGKDRTGWVAALLHTIACVDEQVIVHDYVLTNSYTQERIQATYQQMVASNGKEFADAYLPLLGVQESFLRAGMSQAVTSYGSMAGYISQGLKVSEATQQQLRNKLLA